MTDSNNKLEALEFYVCCIFYKELERMKERALQELESRGWFEEQCCQHQDIFRDSMDTVLSRIDADNFPQDLKESLFVEVLGLFRTFIDEFRKWKCTAEYSS